MKEVPYLGYIISKDGLRPDPEKCKVVAEFPVPRNVKETRAFTGLCNYYRRFVENFAKIAAPLHALTRKNVTFEWTKECQRSV
jgi:hypothetical protein